MPVLGPLHTGGLPRWTRSLLLPPIITLAMLVEVCVPAEIEQARDQYRTGMYVECMEAAAQAIEEGSFSIEWRMLPRFLPLNLFEE